MKMLNVLMTLYQALFGLSGLGASFCAIGVMAGQCPVGGVFRCVGAMFVFAVCMLFTEVMRLLAAWQKEEKTND